MRVDQAEFLLGFLLPQLKSEQRVTKRIMCAVPAGDGGYRPDAKARSAFELARHLAVCEVWFLDAVLQRQFGETAVLPEEVKTCQDVARWYEENVGLRMPRLEKLSGEELATPVDYLGLRNDPAVAYLNIAIRHSVHHRGQLSTYLRPMGGKVPAIYVESGDEAWAGSGDDGEGRPPAF